MDKFYGKYRAIVTNNDDPEQWGRIKVKCPSVLGDYESAWCMPCVPFLCNDEGFFKIPNLQDGVWIEFEGGNLSKPIYVGGWFNPKRMPQENYADAKTQFCLRTKNGTSVIIDDSTGSVTINGDLKVTGSINTSSCNLQCKC